MALLTCRDMRARGLVVVSLAGVCAVACGGRGPTRTPAAVDTPLRVQIGTAMPAAGLPNQGVGELARGLFAEPLVFLDRNGRTRPRLCESWQWLDGGRILQLTLLQGVTFHDGLPFTAETAAMLLAATFKSDSPPASYLSIKQIKVLDDRTLEIQLKRPEALLLEDLNDPRMTKGIVGTGAFVLDGQATTEGATLRAFAAYHQGRPQIEQVDIRTYTSPRSAWTALMRGEISMLYEVSRDAAPFVEAESSVHTYPLLRPYVNALFFNVRHPVLGRRDVRQALSYAIDRDAIVRDVMGGRGERADGPVWKYHWAFSTAQRTYDYNPELARLKLDAAGYPARTAAASNRMPSRLRFTCLLMGNDSRFERLALVVQKQLYDVGVDMHIEAVPLSELVQRFSRGQFDAVFTEAISGRSLSWLYRQWRSSPSQQTGNLSSGYTAADAALDRLRNAFSETEIKATVGDLQSIFYEDPPAIFVAWPQTSRAISAKIQVPYESNMDVVGRLWRAQWATAEAVEK